MDLSVKDGGLPPDSVVQSVDEILADCEEAVKKFHDASRYSMHQVALAPCSPFSVTGELLKESAVLARKLKVRLHTHLAETMDEENYTLEHFHMRPLAMQHAMAMIVGCVAPDKMIAGLMGNGTGRASAPKSGTLSLRKETQRTRKAA